MWCFGGLKEKRVFPEVGGGWNGAGGVDTLADKSKDATRCGDTMYVWKVETTLITI